MVKYVTHTVVHVYIQQIGQAQGINELTKQFLRFETTNHDKRSHTSSAWTTMDHTMTIDSLYKTLTKLSQIIKARIISISSAHG